MEFKVITEFEYIFLPLQNLHAYIAYSIVEKLARSHDMDHTIPHDNQQQSIFII
jgi:hypothetical protein